ncbi:MAG TPA: hypothetical protein VFV67_07930 [Actinophytocola sp.]|uniref:hypothetical protein n=1 Tax=Actinophytocola sp. TaxID=1872138 RepID=UPI002DBC9E39|nr:hypothetical protein [Actinophytocola sp.]HEU5470566.1 hypothetical protein [Actinophytocola sp.]
MVEDNGKAREGLAWGMVVLLAIGFLMVAAVAMIAGLATTACTTAHKRLICDPLAHRVALWTPPTALASGLAILGFGGHRAVRTGRPTGPWQVAAWGVLVVGFMVSYAITTG